MSGLTCPTRPRPGLAEVRAQSTTTRLDAVGSLISIAIPHQHARSPYVLRRVMYIEYAGHHPDCRSSSSTRWLSDLAAGMTMNASNDGASAASTMEDRRRVNSTACRRARLWSCCALGAARPPLRAAAEGRCKDLWPCIAEHKGSGFQLK